MKKFNIKLNVDPEEEKEFDEEVKNGEETSITYEVFQNNKIVGNVDIVVEDGEANIAVAQIKLEDKDKIPFKMFKIILLYFVLQYDEFIYKLTLTVDPLENRGGTKRLVNYYKTLGFIPDDDDVDYEEGVDMTTTTKNMLRHLIDDIKKLC